MTKQTYRFIGTILLTASLLSLGGCSKEEASKYLESAADQAVSAAWDYAKEAVKGQLNDKTNPEIQSSSGTLNVHFIDVGQGDSILIQDGTHFMLVDAGENDQGDTVVNYLKEQGVTSLDYVIGTHPHSDHIGGLDDVRAFNFVDYPPLVHKVDIYAAPHTLGVVRKDFDYAFAQDKYRGVPEIELHEIDVTRPFRVGGF